MITRWLVLLAIGGLASCGGPGNTLDGSISESFSLDFDRVDLRKQGLTLIVEYLREQSGEVYKTCKVTVDTDNVPLGPGTKLEGPTFLERVQLQRVWPSGGDFPAVQAGSITFAQWSFTDGGELAGEFDALFINGRTIHGTFEGTLHEVPLD